jgi:phosphoglycolate phosphatase-like HAD superfamily hydrolase
VVRHVVWDWNGTLFADLEAIVGATNAGLVGTGLAAIDRSRFRRDFGARSAPSTNGWWVSR